MTLQVDRARHAVPVCVQLHEPNDRFLGRVVVDVQRFRVTGRELCERRELPTSGRRHRRHHVEVHGHQDAASGARRHPEPRSPASSELERHFWTPPNGLLPKHRLSHGRFQPTDRGEEVPSVSVVGTGGRTTLFDELDEPGRRLPKITRPC